MGQIRINELARELEVKSKCVLDYLAELSLPEKKTHSSSIEDELAGRIRAHFRALEVAEQEAAARAEAARLAAAKAAAEEAARARAAAEAEARRLAEAKAAEAAALAVPPALRPAATPAARTAPALAGAEVRRVPARPAVPAAATSPAAAAEASARLRPAARAAATAAAPAAGVPKPGQPIYQPKPTPRRPAKTHLEKRFDEAERKLTHPVRARVKPEPGQRKVGPPRAPALPVRTEALKITISEGITVKELAEKLEVRAKDVIRVLFDRGILATINHTLDTELAKSVAEQCNAEVSVLSLDRKSVV